MITVKSIELTDHASEPWGGHDFSKDSLAVVAYGEGMEELCVLWTAGPHVQMEQREYNMRAEEILSEPEDYGIWVWEGRGVWTPGGFEYPEDGEIELVGTYRRPTDAEWAAIRDGRCPWNDEEWKLDELERFDDAATSIEREIKLREGKQKEPSP